MVAEITPYVAGQYPALFSQASTSVRTVAPERTFWEKATILHHEANRPKHLPMPSRYSRHYYDPVSYTHLLGIPEDLVWRQPFPGPGLGIRIIGEVTEDKLDILREADAVYREEIMRASLHRDIGQYFAVLTGIRSVGVMGDERSYDYTCLLYTSRCV